jgi:predicted O-methyltransferase YrrM
MIKLPNFKNSFDYENNFYLSCDNSRIGKLMAHYELFKMTINKPGSVIECGVFKGISLIRFATFRNLLNKKSKKIIGFDMFGKFPETNFEKDQKLRKKFIKDAGTSGISKKQLEQILKRKKLYEKIELIQGDITKTIPKYVEKNPNLKISFLNLDTDVYEPAVTILENLYPKIVRGGILALDDYGIFPGETKAVNDYFRGKNIKINKFAFSKTPHYIIKK